MSDDSFLGRWSRRKIAARSVAGSASGEQDGAQPPPSEALPTRTQESLRPEASGSAVALTDSPKPAEPTTLPPLESLTPDSDFAPFMQSNVPQGLRNLAMKRLFGDPRFNVMDGLDTYIDDYTDSAPLPQTWIDKLAQLQLKESQRAERQPATAQVAGTQADQGPSAPIDAVSPSASAGRAGPPQEVHESA